MEISNDTIYNLLSTIEEEFKEDLTDFKNYVKNSNYKYKITNHKINLFGYQEITDYFRRYLNFEIPKNIHRGKIKYILKENNNCNFYNYKNDILFSIPLNQNYFNLKETDLKIFASFCY